MERWQRFGTKNKNSAVKATRDCLLLILFSNRIVVTRARQKRWKMPGRREIRSRSPTRRTAVRPCRRLHAPEGPRPEDPPAETLQSTVRNRRMRRASESRSPEWSRAACSFRQSSRPPLPASPKLHPKHKRKARPRKDIKGEVRQSTCDIGVLQCPQRDNRTGHGLERMSSVRR